VARRIAQALRRGLRVAMFLDYDGTLREIEAHPSDATPTHAVNDLLGALARYGGMEVTIVSGRTCDDLEAFLAGYPFGLVAEHGARFRRPLSADWEQTGGDADDGWKGRVRDTMGAYADSTPGSFVEEKRTSLVWHYRGSDPAVGEPRARQLLGDLAAVTRGQAVNVRLGRKIVEVTPAGITKGAAVRAIAARGAPCEWIVVAGDDVTDESMFELDLPNLLSIKVGDGATAARYRVVSPENLRGLLRQAVAGADVGGAGTRPGAAL
jgi:trehalose 6-phosphate synthase/phosphatase